MALDTFTCKKKKSHAGTVCARVEEGRNSRERSGVQGKEETSLHKKPWAGCANESLEKLCGSAADSVTNRLPVQSGMRRTEGRR